MGSDLTPRQARFCKEYVVDLDATAACERAGYSVGPTRNVAAVQGSRLLSAAKIQARIAVEHRRLLSSQSLRASQVLDELKCLAFADLRRLFITSDDGKVRLRNITELPLEVAAAISSIDVSVSSGDGASSISRIRLHDKTRALDLLLRRLMPETTIHMHAAFSPAQLELMSESQLDKVEEASRLLAIVSDELSPVDGE